MMLAHALFAVLATTSPSDSLLTADSVLVELQKGGYTILWRHTATDHGVQEPRNYETTPRFQQRNLTDRGVADAKVVGAIFTARGIPIGDVLASPMFRTRETAEYAFGRVESAPILRQLDPSPEQRRFIATKPAAGTNRVLVTHHFVIERNVPGIRPGQLTEGEAVVVRSVGDEAVEAVAIFKMADWQRLGAPRTATAASSGSHGAGLTSGHGATSSRTSPAPAPAPAPAPTAPLAIPSALETPQHAAVAEYLRTFNTGDAARMRQFLERFVVPNPARSMDERLAAYEQLKTNLGAVSILSVDTPEPGRVLVKLQGASGTPATASFGIQTQAPYRLITITYQVGGH